MSNRSQLHRVIASALVGLLALAAGAVPVDAATVEAGPTPGMLDEQPTVEIKGRSIPLDGQPLPPELTAVERLEVFNAALVEQSREASALLASGEGPTWMPLEGTVVLWCTQSNGGYAGCAGHHDEPAMDIGVPVGTAIVAAGPGVVAAADFGGGRGNYVDLDHPDGSSSHYLHLSEMSVVPGQIVARGERLGLSGSTGSSSAPHLHYEERGRTDRPVPIGPMYGRVGTRTVSYPVGQFGLDWPDVDYGTLLTNDGYRPDVGGDLDGDGRPDRADGRLTVTGLGVSLSTDR